MREAQRVCEEGGEAVSTTSDEVATPAREGIKVNRKSATMSNRQANLKAELVKRHAAGHIMCSQLTAVRDGTEILRTKLADSQSTVAKLANNSAWTKANLWAEMVAVKSRLMQT